MLVLGISIRLLTYKNLSMYLQSFRWAGDKTDNVRMLTVTSFAVSRKKIRSKSSSYSQCRKLVNTYVDKN